MTSGDWPTPTPPALPTPGRALAVVAHPDDESWLLGGTLARWSDEGADVHVLCITAGEAGPDHTGETSGPAQREARRRREFDAACAVLGVTGAILGLPDGSLADREDGSVAVRERVAALKPELVLTHGLDGDYGHRDHLAVARWVQALDVDALFAALPPRRMYPLWRGLRRSGFSGVQPGMGPQAFGDVGAVSVSVDPARKRAAVACHRSQLRGEPADFLLAGLLAEPWTSEERFVRSEDVHR